MGSDGIPPAWPSHPIPAIAEERDNARRTHGTPAARWCVAVPALTAKLSKVESFTHWALRHLYDMVPSPARQ